MHYQDYQPIQPVAKMRVERQITAPPAVRPIGSCSVVIAFSEGIAHRYVTPLNPIQSPRPQPS